MNKMLLAWAVLLAMVSPGCGGCVARTEDKPRTEDSNKTSPAVTLAAKPPAAKGMEGADASASALRWSLLIGEEDSTNRYPSTVTVAGHLAASQPERRECSGVLVSPRLVLTAGHCVCARKEAPPDGNGRIFQIDPSTCAATATVVTFTHEVPAQGRARRSRSDQYEGRVRPHPRLRISMDSRNVVLTSKADLALIHLEHSVEGQVPPIPLAKEEVRVGESMTVVGHGYLEDSGGLDGRRRFSRETVAGFLDPEKERFLFGPFDLHAYRGDTGGPCLREGESSPALIGISSRGLGQEPTCTNTYVYREWLEREIELASTADSPEPGGTHSQDAATP